MHAQEVRRPVVAGRFYPSDPEALLQDLEKYTGPRTRAAEESFAAAIGCMVPHAGYIYSGHVAGAVYRRLPARSSYIILCPNHFGRGAPLAIMSKGAWLTPLGSVPIDSSLAQVASQSCHLLAEDANAHSD